MANDPDNSCRKNEPPHLHRLGEALERLKISKAKFYDLLSRGELTIVKIGTSSRVRSDVLDAYIEGLPAGGLTQRGVRK